MKNREQGKSGCWSVQFVVDWTLLTTVAWLLFSPLVVAAGDLGGDDFWTPPDGLWRQLLLYGAVALIISGFQSFALRAVLQRASSWTIATVAGTLLAVVAAFLLGFEQWPEVMIWITVPVALLQGLVLRPLMGWDWLGWFLKPLLLPVSALPGFLIGFLLSALVTDALDNTTLAGSVVGFILLFFPAGLFFGLSTGLLLAWLLARGIRTANRNIFKTYDYQ